MDVVNLLCPADLPDPPTTNGRIRRSKSMFQIQGPWTKTAKRRSSPLIRKGPQPLSDPLKVPIPVGPIHRLGVDELSELLLGLNV